MDDNAFHDIHDYLADQMDAGRKAAFEASLEADPALRSALQTEARLLSGMEELGDRRIRQQVGEAHEKLRKEGFFDQENPQSTTEAPVVQLKKFTAMKRIVSIAAAAVALFGLFWFFNHKQAAADPKELYAKNFKLDTERARNIARSLESHGLAAAPGSGDTVRTALASFEAGDCEKAIALLDPVVKEHPQNDTARFYLAYSHMSRERYARAIELFQPISLDDNSTFRNDAIWNLGLCLLRADGQKEEACKRFQSLADDQSNPKRGQAQAICQMLCGK